MTLGYVICIPIGDAWNRYWKWIDPTSGCDGAFHWNVRAVRYCGHLCVTESSLLKACEYLAAHRSVQKLTLTLTSVVSRLQEEASILGAIFGYDTN